MNDPLVDLTGYGEAVPKVEWPGRSRIAVNFVINFEEGAELSPAWGDVGRETMSESVYATAPGQRELIQESVYQYGSRAGVWRILRVLDRYGVKASVFASGAALERNPGVTAAFAERGYDFVGHGYRWVPHLDMQADEERLAIRRTVETVMSMTGQRLEGWFTRPLPSVNTRRLLQEEGFLYDSDSLADDLPYFTIVNDQPHLVVPYSLDVNDIRFWKGSFNIGEEWYTYVRDSFDCLYDEGSETPKMLSVGLHCRIIGRPGRIGALIRLLEHVTAKDDVWICRRNDLAKHWATHFSAPLA